MSNPITIGVDHGYAQIKTAHFTFPTGLVEYTDFTTSGTWISRPAISFTGFSVRDALSV